MAGEKLLILRIESAKACWFIWRICLL